MSAPKCGDCGGVFTWDAELGSGVCLDCGTMQDPSQTVLSSHLEAGEGGLPDIRQWIGGPTSASLRSARGRLFASQDKEAALARNKNSMHHYISALTMRLGHPGLSIRTQSLLDQAMLKGQFHWGRKAKLVAGACLIISLREVHKSGTLQDIAFLLNETDIALRRVLSIVLRLLEIKLTSDDPSRLLPLFPPYLSELLAEQPSPLPSNLKKILNPLDMQSVSRTAYSLSDLISRTNIFPDPPSSPVSCAIFILSLEAEALGSLPNCGELATWLGKRFGVSKDIIMRRYRAIYEQIEAWLGHVPWLCVQHGHGKKDRAKIARRAAVARGLKDVVQFQEEIWQKKLEELGPPVLDIATNDDEESDTQFEFGEHKRKVAVAAPSCPSKRRKTAPKRPLDAVSRFILSPLDTSASKVSTKAKDVSFLNVVSHLLTTETPFLELPPTRLQLLANTKGEQSITEEELFDEGELEGLLRTKEECAALSNLFDWTQDDNHTHETQTAHVQKHSPNRGGSSRINMEIFNRLLAEDEFADENEHCAGTDLWTGTISQELHVIQGGEGGEIWRRSASPRQASSGDGFAYGEGCRPLSRIAVTCEDSKKVCFADDRTSCDPGI